MSICVSFGAVAIPVVFFAFEKSGKAHIDLKLFPETTGCEHFFLPKTTMVALAKRRLKAVRGLSKT